MQKKLVLTILAVVLATVLAVAWQVVRNRNVDDPARYTRTPISTQDTDGWLVVANRRYGFEIRHPPNYLVVMEEPDELAFRQNGDADEDAGTLGMRIGLWVYDLESRPTIHVGGARIVLEPASTLDDIEQQLARAEKAQGRQRYHERRRFEKHDAMICIVRASGERSLGASGIYKVLILSVHETEQGQRVLITLSNDAGGTPHTRDRALRRDLLQMTSTLRWK